MQLMIQSFPHILAVITAGPLVLTFLLFAGFLIGGIPFGYVAGRIQGLDIRKEGSGNIGATNVFRVLGKKWGTAVFLLDFAKAFIPVCLLRYFLENKFVDSSFIPGDLVLILTGAAIVCGHNYSPFMGFKGGKGMASSAGFIFALFPLSGLACVVSFALFFYLTKYVSVGSIVASVVLPLSTILFYPEKYWLWGLAFFLGAMSVWRHRANIQRLKAGTELRAGEKKA
jgi:acyl phosphate:glycerol-3-phosphate acyltransferase